MYCRNCGAVIDGNSQFCSNCGQNPHEANNYCPECGHFCIPGDTSCIQCHTSLARQSRISVNISNGNANAQNNSGYGSGFVTNDNQSGFVQQTPPSYQQSQPQAQSYQQSQQKGNRSYAEPNYLSADKKYCRNCGLVIPAGAHKCGFCDSTQGSNYCMRCGSGTRATDTVCSVCATPLSIAKNVGYIAAPPPVVLNNNNGQMQGNGQTGNNGQRQNQQSDRGVTTGLRNDFSDGKPASFETTLVLCIVGFFGVAGIHRILTRHYVSGIIMLLSGGCMGIWTLIDLIMICSGSFKDAEGRALVR